jgi:hypothetical protein
VTGTPPAREIWITRSANGPKRAAGSRGGIGRLGHFGSLVLWVKRSGAWSLGSLFWVRTKSRRHEGAGAAASAERISSLGLGSRCGRTACGAGGARGPLCAFVPLCEPVQPSDAARRWRPEESVSPKAPKRPCLPQAQSAPPSSGRRSVQGRDCLRRRRCTDPLVLRVRRFRAWPRRDDGRPGGGFGGSLRRR